MRRPRTFWKSAKGRAVRPLALSLLLASGIGCSTASQPSPTPARNETSRSTPEASTGLPGNDAASRDTREPEDSYGHSRHSRHRARAQTTAAPGTFDFYLLTLSWEPEYCHSHAGAAECKEPSTFVLHGLWPQNNDGTYPESCSDAPGPTNPDQYTGLYPNTGLLEHEWSEHGTCSGLTPDAYFTAASHAKQEITIPPALAQLKAATSIAPQGIVTLFQQSNRSLVAGSVAISCGNNYLTAVEICLDKNLKPQACQAVRSCAANSVRIHAPQ